MNFPGQYLTQTLFVKKFFIVARRKNQLDQHQNVVFRDPQPKKVLLFLGEFDFDILF